MVVGLRLECVIDDRGREFAVIMTPEGLSKLIDCIESTLTSGGGFALDDGDNRSILFRPAMIVDYRVSACKDGSLVVSLSKDALRILADRLRPLCVPEGLVKRVHFDVCGDHTKPDIETVVFERQ